MSTRFRIALSIGVAAFLLPAGVTVAGDLDRTIALVVELNTAAAQSQKKVDALEEKRGDMLAQYRAVQQQLAAVRDYNAQTEKLVVAQREQMAGLQKQIDDATLIGRQVTPLMLEMIDALEAFVDLDVPFLLEERKDRVAQLRAMMDRPNVTEAEKYRRIMEAFQIENDYGRTIEAYRGPLSADGKDRTVEFLRVGRVSLIYRTFDGAELGFWDKSAKKWSPLPAEYRGPIKRGFRIARKQAAPNLFRVPVPAPEAVSK